MRQTFLLLFFALPFSLVAQQEQQYTPEGYPILSLPQCIQMAINCSSDIMQRQAEGLSAEIQLSYAKSSFLPRLDAQVGQSFNFGRSEDVTGVIINHSAATTNLGVGLSYTLFSGMRRLGSLHEAESAKAANESDLQGTKDRIALDVIGMYYQTLMQEDMIRLSEANLAQTRYHLNYTRSMVKAGKWALTKQLELEAQLANEELSMVDNRNELYLTRLNLALNIDYGAPDSLAIINPDIDHMVEIALTKLYPSDMVYDYAMNNRAEISAVNKKLEMTKLGIRIARSGFIPTLAFNAGYSTSYFYPFEEEQRKLTRDFSTQLSNNGRYFVGFTLTIPIFDAMQTPNAIREAKVRYNLAEINHKRVREALYRQVMTARANASSSSQKIAVAEKSAKTTRESLKLTEEAFEAGRATPLELEQARNRSLIAEMQLIRAKYDFVYKTAILEHYSGHSDLQ